METKWIQTKTYYNIKTDADIHKVLLYSKIKPLNNVFELNIKNIKSIKEENYVDMDIVVLEANMVKMKVQISNSSLSRGNSNNYIVCCKNIRNGTDEYFSSLIDTLCENDKIVLVNVIVQKSVKSVCYNDQKLIVTVRPENNSSFFIFKEQSLLPAKLNVLHPNLSQLTEPGSYPLFGCVKKIIKYSDDDYMLLILQCNDKSCIKIRKYPHSVSLFKEVPKVEKTSGVNYYDLSSNKVDVLIKHPCIDFSSLVAKQRIFLNNVKVKYSSHLYMYLLEVKGDKSNLKADPIETSSINSLRLPSKVFQIPDELKPASYQQKHITAVGSQESHITSTDIQLASKKKLNKITHPPKRLKLSTKKSHDYQMKSENSSSDDNVNLSPCIEFSTPKHIHNKNNNVNNDGLICNKNMKDDGGICDSFFKDTDYQIPKCNTNMSTIPLNKNNTSKKRIEFTSRENSPALSSDGSCSPSYFNTCSTDIATSKKIQPQSKNINLSNVKQPTQCIGPCVLTFFEPSVFDDFDIVNGYCTKCSAFLKKYILKSSSMGYKCPICFNIVKLTFFFKMIFLYGTDNNLAIEVCCYEDVAARVIKKMTKKNITIESYLLNCDYKKIISNTIKSFISCRTKVNIIVCKSPIDNCNILLSLDTKYIVTTTTN